MVSFIFMSLEAKQVERVKERMRELRKEFSYLTYMLFVPLSFFNM